MNLDLSSVWAKFGRSQEHADAVQNEAKTWANGNPYRIQQEVNADSTRYSAILRVIEPAPFERWSLAIADCLYNLRCSLDHLVYALARHEVFPNPPAYEDRLSFPITDSPANFSYAVDKRHVLGDVSALMRSVVESFQPYHRPHPDLPPLLAVLRDLNSRDKHKLLQIVYSSVFAVGDLRMVGGFPHDGRTFEVLTPSGEIKDGAEILATTFSCPTPNMTYDGTVLEIMVAIRHGKRDPTAPKGSDRSEFASLLNLLSAEVRNVIDGVSAQVS